jgi:hypothetical protein
MCHAYMLWPLAFYSHWCLSAWQAGEAMRSAMLVAARKRPPCERTLRTPLLSLHVSTLTPTGERRPRERKFGARLKPV